MKAGLPPNTPITPDKPVCPTPARWLGCCSPLRGEPRAWLQWWLGDFSLPPLSGLGCLLQGLQVQRWGLFSVVFAASEGVEVRCGAKEGQGQGLLLGVRFLLVLLVSPYRPARAHSSVREGSHSPGQLGTVRCKVAACRRSWCLPVSLRVVCEVLGLRAYFPS